MAEDEQRPSGDVRGEAAAEALALSAASRGKADRFLDEQTRVAQAQVEFLHLQADDMRHDEALRRRILRLDHSSALMKVAFEAAVALIVLLVIVIVGSALWSAAHDDGLVVESFSVPPDMAGRGLSGDVVAAHLLDRLAQLQAQTSSNRAASSYANDWGNNVKVQIPDTGISIGQAYAYLAQWLGNQTHISGEVFRDAKGGITVTARVGADASPSFAGSEADFDKLLQQAAEAIYRKTQPYRYAVYLSDVGRTKDAEAAYRTLIADGSTQDRAWAYVGLSTIYQFRGDLAGCVEALRNSLEIYPDFILAYGDLGNAESALQHEEASLAIERKLATLLHPDSAPDVDKRGLTFTMLENEAALDSSVGDYQAELAIDRRAERLPEFAGQVELLRVSDLAANAFAHDGEGLRRALAVLPPTSDANMLVNRDASLLNADFLMGRWAATLADAVPLQAMLPKFGHAGDAFRTRAMTPLLAGARAMIGSSAAADAQIAPTPADCDLCVRIRGRIASAERRWGAAGYWFAMLSAREPSIPFADTDWGQVLLEKGDLDGAIAKFESANRKGPHFADPLEMWGEALIAKNRSDLALAKFAEADKYAPNWGRLHLKWGEALLWAGTKDEAMKQLAVAARLDLTSAEKSELARMRGDHG